MSSVLLTIRILNEVFKEAFATSNTAEFQAFTNALEKQVRNLLRLIDTIWCFGSDSQLPLKQTSNNRIWLIESNKSRHAIPLRGWAYLVQTTDMNKPKWRISAVQQSNFETTSLCNLDVSALHQNRRVVSSLLEDQMFFATKIIMWHSSQQCILTKCNC